MFISIEARLWGKKGKTGEEDEGWTHAIKLIRQVEMSQRLERDMLPRDLHVRLLRDVEGAGGGRGGRGLGGRVGKRE